MMGQPVEWNVFSHPNMLGHPMDKVALAFSGGLDTSICIDYLKRRKGLEVVTYCANLGQVSHTEPLGEKSLELGAAASHLENVQAKFAEEFILPVIRAKASYGEGYYLGCALARPLIARELVQVAREEGCAYLAHGCRGVGNDSIRFERLFGALAPEKEIISPLAELGVDHPGEDIEYAHRTSIPVDRATETIYNVEENLWCTNIQLTPFKDEWEEPPAETYIRTLPPEKAPDQVIEMDITFEEGKPVSVDGEERPLHELIDTLNRIGRKFAVGRIDVIEHRLTGRKTREIYEQPGATLIFAAYSALESLVLSGDVLEMKRPLEEKYGRLVYEGNWFSEQRKALDSFFRHMNRAMSGTVRLRISRGMVRVIGRRSLEGGLDRFETREDIQELKSRIKEIESNPALYN